MTIFERLGVSPVINACGIYTDLGGSRLSPMVWQAMAEMNEQFVSMPALLDQTGDVLAAAVGAEAARVTPGAAAAIMLGIAACMAGTDGKAWEQLPDVSGLRHEVVIQHLHRYKYDRQAWMTGARRVEVGDASGTTSAEMEAAIGPDTAAVLHPGHLDGRPGALSLQEVAKIARHRGVPVFVDAAYLNYPTSVMSSFVERGADLVCFSAKYFGGPNAGGFVAGRRSLIDAVAGIDFTRYESGQYLTYGRPLKLDRQNVVAVVVALQEWLALDHAARLRSYGERVERMVEVLRDVPRVVLSRRWFTMDERLIDPEPANCLVVELDHGDSDALAARLWAGRPAVACVAEPGRLILAVDALRDGEELIVAETLRRVLLAGE